MYNIIYTFIELFLCKLYNNRLINYFKYHNNCMAKQLFNCIIHDNYNSKEKSKRKSIQINIIT